MIPLQKWGHKLEEALIPLRGVAKILEEALIPLQEWGHKLEEVVIRSGIRL